MDCVEVCPVDCFYEGENMLVIHPDECIDCGVCEPECPVDAIKADSEPGLEKWLSLNAEYARIWPNITVKKAPPPDSKEWEGKPDKLQYFSPNDAAYDTLPAAGFCAETRAQPLIAPLAADLYLRKRSVFGCPPRPLAKFGLGIDRRPTHNSPMNKLYYERADYSVVVKNRAPRFTGPEMSTPSRSHRSISTLPRRPINLLTFSNFGRIG